MTRNGRKVLIALPKLMLEQADVVATKEHRTRSDLMREALRRYLAAFHEREVSLAYPIGVESVT